MKLNVQHPLIQRPKNKKSDTGFNGYDRVPYLFLQFTLNFINRHLQAGLPALNFKKRLNLKRLQAGLPVLNVENMF